MRNNVSPLLMAVSSKIDSKRRRSMNKVEEYIRQEERKKNTSLIMLVAFGCIVATLVFALLRFFY